MQVQLLVAQPTLMKDLDQFNLLAFNAMEQKLDYRTVLTQHKILAPTQLMLVLHVLVSSMLTIGRVNLNLQHPQFVLLVTSDWLEVLLQMKDVLNFASTMPGAPSVMMALTNVMPMSSVVSLAILTKVEMATYSTLCHLAMSYMFL